MSLRAAIVRPGAPDTRVLGHWRLGLTSWGLQTRSGRPREGLSAWLRSLWGELQPRGRV